MTKRKPEPRVLLYRGWLLCGLDKFALAETEFAKALRIAGVDADAHRFLALIAATRPSPTATEKQRTDAVENAQRACDLTKSEDWLSFEALAAARAAAGQFDEALTAARRATELASGENRQRCEERAKLYEAQQPLRLDWPRATRFAAGP